MKKVLSMLLALAMVLTMAAFPAFAEGETVALTAITNPNPQSGHTSDMAVDGDETTYYATSGYIGSTGDASSSYKLKLELAETITLDSLELYWAGSGWGYFPANKYKVYVSADNETYTEILYYENLCAGTDTYDGKVVYGGSVGSGSLQARVTETNLNIKNVKYIYIEMIGWKYRAALAEVYVTKKDTASLTPTTYTVKYEYEDGSEALADKVVEDVYVGDPVTENAPEIVGYLPDETSKSITLADGTNEIVFTYYPREAASYTVYYQDTEGNDLADATVVTEGVYEDDVVTVTPVTIPSYKPTEASKTVTLAAGENEIVFTYEAKSTVTYTVEYVDEEGKPVADAKTGSNYEDEVIAEIPATVSGYFCIDVERTKKLTLTTDEENNFITFTYKKVLVPTTVERKQASGLSNSGSDLARLYDGNLKAITQYTVSKDYDFSVRPAEYTYTFSSLTQFDKISLYTSYNRHTKVKFYTSVDGENWNLVLSSDTVRADQTSLPVVTEADKTATIYLNEFTLPAGTTGTMLKYEIVETNVSTTETVWCGIYEMVVEGEALAPADLSDAKVIKQNSWGWNDGGIENDPSLLFDGESATNSKGYYGHGYFSASSQPNNYFIEIDLGAVYTDPTLAIQGGASDWNYAHLLAYDVYVAGVDGKYGETPAAVVDQGTTVTSSNKIRADILSVEGDVRFVKLVVNYAERRPVIGEISVYGDKVDFTAEPEKAGVALGGQIRLPSGKVPAGLRFGATIAKDVFGDVLTDGYNYSELAAAGIKVGMFILPIDLLDGNATLADYIANDGDKALDIAAEKIYAEDDFAVTFTAVVTSIPEKDYARKVVAAPYICVDGVYTFYAEMTRDYTTVTEAVAADYEAGEITLTADQITLIEAVLGRTLVAPEVSE